MRAPLLLPSLVILAWIALPVTDAAAQFGRSNSSRVPRDGAPTARPAPPPALPGLLNRRPVEPIPAEPGQVLSPNAALFDAINRGDLPAARDAVARGADLDSQNVLGLTPVDSAVDQGRTEIMFYLLSVRGAARNPGPPPQATAAAPGKPPKGSRNATPQAREADFNVPAPAPTVRNPRLWAGDGGTAQPDIGFLGFDAGRPAGAVAPAGAAPERAARATSTRRAKG